MPGSACARCGRERLPLLSPWGVEGIPAPHGRRDEADRKGSLTDAAGGNACSPTNGRQPPGGAASERFCSSRGQTFACCCFPRQGRTVCGSSTGAGRTERYGFPSASSAHPSSGSSNGRCAEDDVTRNANCLILKCGSGSSSTGVRLEGRPQRLTPCGCERNTRVKREPHKGALFFREKPGRRSHAPS